MYSTTVMVNKDEYIYFCIFMFVPLIQPIGCEPARNQIKRLVHCSHLLSLT